MAEKLRPGERAQAGAIRAFKEEVGKDMTERLGFAADTVEEIIDDMHDRIQDLGVRKREEVSKSYSGVVTIYKDHLFSFELPPALWNSLKGGVQETTEKKTTFFVWKEVPSDK